MTEKYPQSWYIAILHGSGEDDLLNGPYDSQMEAIETALYYSSTGTHAEVWSWQECIEHEKLTANEHGELLQMAKEAERAEQAVRKITVTPEQEKVLEKIHGSLTDMCIGEIAKRDLSADELILCEGLIKKKLLYENKRFIGTTPSGHDYVYYCIR